MSASHPAPRRRSGASGAHRFVEPEDSRSGLALSSSHSPSLQMGPAMAVTGASMRDRLCAAPGCGKPRLDAIHEPVG